MNNQHADINVGKPNFQPVPKRFMVWDKEEKKFSQNPFSRDNIFTLVDVCIFLVQERLFAKHPVSRYVIFQSTNLFDKDGKEIFEGSIIHALMAKWLVKQDKGCMCAFNYRTGVVMPLYKIEMSATKNIGHIFSDPELLGGKCQKSR